MRSFTLRTLAAAAAFITQATVGSCSDVCDTIESTTNIDVLRPLSLGYQTEQAAYWSTGASLMQPSCILTPTTANEVSVIVKALLNSTERFAIKSGGHNPNNNFSSIQGGPLISTSHLNEVTLDTASQTVRIGPGNRWDDVSAALDGTGYTAVGGRIGNVGVGGLLLGGGLSFLSTQYGWAANNVVAFELVLANASIVTVSQQSHPDLFIALKGGGNNFGIVTAFTVRAHPQGQVWGGNLFFAATDTTNTALLAAARDFTQYYPDPKAAIIVTAEMTAVGTVDSWIMFLFYDGPTPPPGVFDNFTGAAGVTPLTNTCKTQSYNDFVTANNWAVVKGNVYTIGTETMPLPKVGSRSAAAAGLEVLESIHSHWRNVSESVLLVPGVISSIAYQPFPRRFARLARSMGGDLYDFDDDVDRIILEFDYSFTLPSDFSTIDQAVQDTYGGFRDRVVAYTRQGVLPSAYLPLFQNDGYFRQDYFGRLRADRGQLAARVRDSVDPNGLWTDRTGGFKI
ncbi:FAD binding domain-containing protein [Diplogelasinospora grovesii]|uniref:FAD binding domain-containing protein n=1 Tax=Diplogelasinospora grovesii TaxID=303347 RepID=A0AAN6N4K9_9PEZI|nr:FAD binding domain-containing protein [Diplogelasinospora grovesii]